MDRLPKLQIGDDLRISIGEAAVQLTPTRGLELAERLARASFRKVLAEEAGLAPRRPVARTARRAARA